ncbi:two component transcriptional regulator, LytTR family [Reichenbachiella agariperforans]|uniref:Two component transcriptional regulator, LytTR family n=1 Tax=Reichenbachiella agariperforans TaxID=156994 RepID=A0A1M6V790_REIAG|nr:response regulator transcription factor [Reichenbachiella agariperforans]SHK77342.1 two component transcriptional regulator, LytTR family [Reichenbachiella agariperforans]
MAKLKILVAEDDTTHATKMEMLLDEMEYNCVGVHDNEKDLLRSIQIMKPDVIVLDISLKNTDSGISIAQKIQRIRPTPFLFVTSFDDKETLGKAMETNPYAYLIKPVERGNLQAAIELAIHKFSRQETTSHTQQSEWNTDVLVQNSFFLKRGSKLEKVQVKDILWIELTDERYCQIITTTHQYHLRMSLKALEQQLDPKLFLRVHRAYIVSIDRINSIEEADLMIGIEGREIPFGRSYKTVLFKRLQMLH